MTLLQDLKSSLRSRFLRLVAPPVRAQLAPPRDATTPQPRQAWIPIRTLASRHRGRVLTHLLTLTQQDRYLRFGYVASDEQIARYAARLDFYRDEVFGVFNRRLELIAMAHLAYAPPAQLEGKPPMVEFGVSVLKKARGHGLGARLFEHAVLHARNRGVGTLFIYALSENTAMLRIASKAGAKVERSGPDSEAWLALPGQSLASQVGERLGRHAAEVDYQVKRRTRRAEAATVAAAGDDDVGGPDDRHRRR
jgi:RimJ/RimL family protein N-acetyltransferase